MAPKIITVTVTGLDKLTARLAKFRHAAPAVLAHALYEQAEVFLTYVKDKHVPVMDGPLRASGFVRPPELLPGLVRVVLGFGGSACKYAVAVHENPRSGKTGGYSPAGRRYKKWAKVGHWKYLEEPLMRLQARLPALLAARIKREWESVLGG